MAFDGMGIKRSTDGIHWTPEPANPVFYMGPYAKRWKFEDYDSADTWVVSGKKIREDGITWKM